jgi:hypothetical protein
MELSWGEEQNETHSTKRLPHVINKVEICTLPETLAFENIKVQHSECLNENFPLSYPSEPVVKNEKVLWRVTKSELDTVVSSSYTQLHRYLRRWHTKFKYNLLWVSSFLCSD